MRWKEGRRSTNVEDRRGERVSTGATLAAPLLLFRFIPALFRSKTGRVVLVAGVVLFFGARLMGIDLLPMLLGGGQVATTTQPREFTPGEQEAADFASAVLASTEDTWGSIFSSSGAAYEQPTLVLFSGAVNSACGMASAAVGPFYCPMDRKVYLDLSFFDDLRKRHGAPGDFAQAYVIAHEIGHHVQTLTGVSQRVRAAGSGRSQREVNALSVRQELQADCYAGVWGHVAAQRGILEPGDLEEALNAASAIGDDRLQREAQGRVVPDSFTHGTSAQRVQWFRTGFESGDVNACDTFSR